MSWERLKFYSGFVNKFFLLLNGNSFFCCLWLGVDTRVILSEHSEDMSKILLLQTYTIPSSSGNHLVEPVMVDEFQFLELLLSEFKLFDEGLNCFYNSFVFILE